MQPSSFAAPTAVPMPSAYSARNTKALRCGKNAAAKAAYTGAFALQLIHGYVNAHARKYHTLFRRLLKLPGLYHAMPGIFAKGVAEKFGPAAGFRYLTHEATKDVIRFDMLQCPYHDACRKYGCPELCRSFCDSDDITYDGLHPKLLWHRTKTLGRGNDCCDFGLMVQK